MYPFFPLPNVANWPAGPLKILALCVFSLMANLVTQAQSCVGSATTVAGTGVGGTSANQLEVPLGVALDQAGYLYVADLYNDRIQKFPPNSTAGTAATTVAAVGSAANQVRDPHYIAVDQAGYLYVADAGNRRIQKFPPNPTAGAAATTVAGTGTAGSNANQLNFPYGLAIDAAGFIYVSDLNNHRIQKFPPNSTAGTAATTVAGTGTPGSNANQLTYPKGIALDQAGFIYVADFSNHRIQKFPPNSTAGTAGTTVAGTGTPGSNANQVA